MRTPRIEHFVDIAAGTAVDRDYEGEFLTLEPDPAIAEKEEQRLQALARLKALARVDQVVADMLTVLGAE